MDDANYRRLAEMPVGGIMAENVKLRTALKPFADCCDALEGNYPGVEKWHDNVAAYSGMRAPTMGELRRAREALK
jgi:hypothetical protein